VDRVLVEDVATVPHGKLDRLIGEIGAPFMDERADTLKTGEGVPSTRLEKVVPMTCSVGLGTSSKPLCATPSRSSVSA
jgi:hypothetical protein